MGLILTSHALNLTCVKRTIYWLCCKFISFKISINYKNTCFGLTFHRANNVIFVSIVKVRLLVGKFQFKFTVDALKLTQFLLSPFRRQRKLSSTSLFFKGNMNPNIWTMLEAFIICRHDASAILFMVLCQ